MSAQSVEHAMMLALMHAGHVLMKLGMHFRMLGNEEKAQDLIGEAGACVSAAMAWTRQIEGRTP